MCVLCGLVWFGLVLLYAGGLFFEKVVWGQLLSELCASILVLDKRKIRRLCCTTATRRLRPQTRFVSDFSTRFKTFFRLQSQAHRHVQCVCIQHIHSLTHTHTHTPYERSTQRTARSAAKNRT